MKTILLLLLLSAPLAAQSTVTLSGMTEAGDPVFSMDGKKYLGFTSEQVKAINDKLDRLDQLEAALPICQKLNADYKARLDTELLRSQNWKSLFDAEHELRIGVQQFQKRPSRFTSWMEKPLPKLIITFAPPVINFLKN